MSSFIAAVIVAVVVAAVGLALSIRIVTQYQKGVVFRLGRVHRVAEPGLTFIVPVIAVAAVSVTTPCAAPDVAPVVNVAPGRVPKLIVGLAFTPAPAGP